jgi:NitT/TauT family transport system substrate-binding protein
MRCRIFILSLLLSLLSSFLFSQDRSDFRFGYTGNINESPVFIAKEKGFFKEEGLKVELIKIEEDKIGSLLNSRSVDAVLINPYFFNNLDSVKLTGAVSSRRVEAVIRSNTSIKVCEDLQGKRIGVEKLNGNEEVSFSLELIRGGLDPLEDVRWVEIEKGKFINELNKGNIDCFLTDDPGILSSVDNKNLMRLYNISYDGSYRFYYPYFLGSNPSFANAEFKKIVILLKALKKASAWIDKNNAGTFEIIKKGNYLSDKIKDGKIFGFFGWNPVSEKEKNRFLNFTLEKVKQNMLPPTFDIKSFEKNHFIGISRNILQEDEVTDYKVSEECCNYPL